MTSRDMNKRLKELQAARSAWVLNCPHCCALDQQTADPPVPGLRGRQGALGLREVKGQGLLRAEGFSVYYKIHYTNTADRKV